MSFLFSLSYSFGLFPATSHITAAVEGYAGDSLRRIFAGVVSYLPNLAFLIVLAVLIYYGLKLLRLILNGLGTGVIALPGFYPEWAGPTYNLLAFLTVLFALVVAFPYLPGGDSPVLRGVSLFIGVLVSLGSGSAMGNVVAGIILTYMRSFRVGDRVKIADTTGDVMEQTLLVTRLRTIKNEEITIPNSLILGAHVMNYSAANLQRRLILHVTLTIGYDVPWRQVHDLLLAAARDTPRTLADPPPFILYPANLSQRFTHQLSAQYPHGPAATNGADLLGSALSYSGSVQPSRRRNHVAQLPGTA